MKTSITGARRTASRLLVKFFCFGFLFSSAAVFCANADPPNPSGLNPEVRLSNLADFSLEALLNMEVTSVAKKEQKLSETAAAVYVVGQEELRRSGATTIAEALRSVPGIEVARLDSHNWAITSRGFNDTFANKLLVMMDGRSVYTPLFSGVHWDVQDTLMEDIDRIEVIRGPGASLWGANAVNGVINIITKSAKDTQGGLLFGGGGTEERGFGGARYGGKISSNAYYRVYGKYLARDGSAAEDGSDANDAWEMGRGGFRIDWDAADKNRLTFQGDIYDGDLDQSFTLFSSTPRNASFTAPYSTRVSGGNLIGRWTHQIGDESDFRVQAYYDRTRRDYILLKENRDTFDIDFQHRFPLGDRQDIIWGTGYRVSADEIGNSFDLVVDPDRETVHLFNGFVQDEIVLVEDELTLTLGTKLEHNDFTGFEIQPSGRIAWTPHARHTLWASAARAVRTPSRTEVDGRLLIDAKYAPLEELFPGLPPILGSIKANPSFESEDLRAFEIGYRVQPHSKLTLDAATFYNLYDNLRSGELGTPIFEFAPPPPHFNLLIGNGLSGETYGAELAANWQLTDWWRWSVSYTFLKIQIHTDPNSTDTSQERINETGSPAHRVAFRSMMDLPRGFELDAGIRHVGGMPRGGIPGYLVADVRLGWHPVPSLELSIVGQNLLDDRHREYAPDLIRIQKTDVQHSVYAKATWRF
ncbi:MAG: TonB-dependent receptor [Verrucomicrobia bacterium]|nr:TonB-dependent receptor [Verrucomicrobiota bacterium]